MFSRQLWRLWAKIVCIIHVIVDIAFTNLSDVLSAQKLGTTASLAIGFALVFAVSTEPEPSFSVGETKLNKLANPLRILGVFPYNGYSHFIMSKSLMLGLAKRGHNVTVVSPFPLTSPVENYTDIDISDRFPSLSGIRTFEEWVEHFKSNIHTRLKNLAQLCGPQLCRDTFTHPKVTKLLQHKNQFDVVFTEVFGSDCFSAVGYILQVPTINLITSHTISWMYDYLGETQHPAIKPSHFIQTSHLDTVWARLENTFYNIASKLFYYFEITRPSEAVIRDLLSENIPPLSEIRHNVSLVIINSHPSIFGASSIVPRALYAAGIHLEPADPRKVSGDVRLWLDTAPSGVLYFSLGSLLNGETLPAQLRTAFLEAFAEMKPLRVLWKFKGHLDGLPDNVKLVEWIPQVEILSHPNISAFMTHAGAMSVIESVYYGVPMVGVPIFADQLINTYALEKLGCAVYLDHRTLRKDDVVKAVGAATTDPIIRRRANEVSQLFRDRPMSPLDSAIWWTEYVARHGGAHQLESPMARMPFWKYALLDVLIAFIVIVLLTMYVIYFLITRLTLWSTKMSRNKKRD